MDQRKAHLLRRARHRHVPEESGARVFGGGRLARVGRHLCLVGAALLLPAVLGICACASLATAARRFLLLLVQVGLVDQLGRVNVAVARAVKLVDIVVLLLMRCGLLVPAALFIFCPDRAGFAFGLSLSLPLVRALCSLPRSIARLYGVIVVAVLLLSCLWRSAALPVPRTLLCGILLLLLAPTLSVPVPVELAVRSRRRRRSLRVGRRRRVAAAGTLALCESCSGDNVLWRFDGGACCDCGLSWLLSMGVTVFQARAAVRKLSAACPSIPSLSCPCMHVSTPRLARRGASHCPNLPLTSTHHDGCDLCACKDCVECRICRRCCCCKQAREGAHV